MLESLPVRVASIHQSFDDTPILRLLRAVLAGVLLGADKKIRLQCHFEDDWEIRYKLLGYGIPIDSKLTVVVGVVNGALCHMFSPFYFTCFSITLHGDQQCQNQAFPPMDKRAQGN